MTFRSTIRPRQAQRGVHGRIISLKATGEAAQGDNIRRGHFRQPRLEALGLSLPHHRGEACANSTVVFTIGSAWGSCCMTT